MVKFILERGNYPSDLSASEDERERAIETATWKGDGLTTAQKQAILDSVTRATANGSPIIVSLLLTYITPLPSRRLQDQKTRDLLADGILTAAKNDHTAIAELLLDIAYNPDTSEGQEIPESLTDERADVINIALVIAAEYGEVMTAKLLLDKYGADVNYHQRPQQASALYRAAGNGRMDMTKVLLEEYGADIHAGNGRYANG